MEIRLNPSLFLYLLHLNLSESVGDFVFSPCGTMYPERAEDSLIKHFLGPTHSPESHLFSSQMSNWNASCGLTSPSVISYRNAQNMEGKKRSNSTCQVSGTARNCEL